MVLRAGARLRLDGQVHTVCGLDGSSARLADVTGTVTVVALAELLSDPTVEVLTHSRVPMAPQPMLDQLPPEVFATARWWERHLLEVVTGLAPDAPAGTRPRPAYDPAQRSLRQRELAKHDELRAEGHRVGISTVQRLRYRYERDGIWGLVDQRAGKAPTSPGRRVDPRVVEATRQAIAEETDRSTGTVARLRRRAEQILATSPDPPAMPPARTFYRLVGRLSAGRHSFGSARTRRSLAKQPDRAFGQITATRPGEWVQIDSTPLDVRVVLDDGTVDRVELTGLVDQATRTIPAAVLRPTTKAVDAALLLAHALTPEPMRPGWTDALRLSRSVLPHQSLTAIDARLAHAAARPVIAPESIVYDHGKAYLSATFRTACRTLGINLQPAHPDTPTDKPIIESALGSVATLFAQYVAGYVGSSVERRGRHAEAQAVWSMVELQALLDEWVVAVWQIRPHDGLRDPITPGQALTPNEAYAALVTDPRRLRPDPARGRGLHPAAAHAVAHDQRLRRPTGTTHLQQRRTQSLPPPALRCGSPQRPLGSPPRPLRHLPDLDPQPPPRRLADRHLETPAHRPGPLRRGRLEPRPRAGRGPRQRPGHRSRDRRRGRRAARPRRERPRPRTTSPRHPRHPGTSHRWAEGLRAQSPGPWTHQSHRRTHLAAPGSRPVPAGF